MSGIADTLLENACEKAGLRIVQAHTPKWSVGFRRQWRGAFAAPQTDWRLVKYEWELLGSDLARALEKRAAIREFERRRAEARQAYVTLSLDYREVFEVEGVLPGHAWWRAAVHAQDLYIVHGEWTWSFVLTHEEQDMGIGPFFVENVASSP